MTDTRQRPRPGRKLLRRGQRLTRTEAQDEGRMPLIEHLRELRNRLLVSVAALVPGTVLGLVYYRDIAGFLVAPVCRGNRTGEAGACPDLTQVGLVSPLTTALLIGIATGIFVAAPVLLYQLWAFITPGLHRHEKRWSLAFLATSIPLFFAGAALCYWLLPNAIRILLDFTIAEADNLLPLDDYLNILVRLIIVFGIGFDIPVFLVLLNAVGVLRAATLRKSWRWIVVGCLVFAAMASPTGDPGTMLGLALPMMALSAFAYGICYWNDRRRGVGREVYAGIDDDEASELDTAPSRPDDRP